ncbi:uncharacterized protein RSE6_13974 [Rhynchosporium secalis]|uniref:Uncharacterized protein n=1 Tax=Rhynchosporium secalis TaxID=38038 RepID=A0A1E1MU73_RHYSE|nr:uncharacterized protein RSE6_13974 [Rhynchosporium secalis]
METPSSDPTKATSITPISEMLAKNALNAPASSSFLWSYFCNIYNLSSFLPEDQPIIEMKLRSVAKIFGAICNAGPLTHREEATQNWPAHTLSYIDSAPERIDR